MSRCELKPGDSLGRWSLNPRVLVVVRGASVRSADYITVLQPCSFDPAWFGYGTQVLEVQR